MRVARGAVIVGLVALVPLLGAAGVGSGGVGATAPRVTAFVAPGGSDAGRCTRSAPCASFDRAYRVASCGEIIQVAAGEYPTQQLNHDASKVRCALGRRVVFRPAPRAAVRVAQIRVGGGDGPGGLLPGARGADHVQIERLAVSGMVSVANASDVAYVRVQARTFYVNAGRNVVIRGGSYGPCTASVDSQDFCQQNRIEGATSSVTIDGVTIHDYRISHPDDHYECLLVISVVRLTIRNSRFTNCEFFAILFSSPRVDPLHTITLENNWFATPWDGRGNQNRATAVAFGEPLRNTVVRSNSFDAQTGLSETLTGTPADGSFRVIGNVLGSTNVCQSGVVYTRNVRTASAPCSATDRGVPWGYVVVGGELRPVPATAAAIRRLFAEASRGRPLQRVVRDLRTRRLPSPTGAPWTVAAARRVLRDRAYLGGQWGARATHRPIVTRRVWNAAQRRLGR